MKKKLIIALVLAALLGAAYAGARCMSCGGSGWSRYGYKCPTCGGDGEIGN